MGVITDRLRIVIAVVISRAGIACTRDKLYRVTARNTSCVFIHTPYNVESRFLPSRETEIGLKNLG